jgi:nitroreductase
LDSSTPAATLSDSEFNRLVEAAIRAPSADNSQPWTLARHPAGIVAGLVGTARPMFFDADGWAGEVSLGAAVENIVQVAPSLGLAASVEPLQNHEALVRLRRQPGQGETALTRVVFTRHTHRGYLRATPIPPAVAQGLVAAVDASGFSLRWAASRTARARLITAVQQAEVVRFTHAQIHDEFHESLRFGRAQEQRPDGLAADTLGIERALVPALRLVRPWPITRALNALGMHHFMVWRGATLPLKQAPLIGALLGPPDAPGFDAGRILERVWLAAEAAGVAFQAFGALPLLLRHLRPQQPADDQLSRPHRERLLRADNAWRLATDASGEQLLMIVRIGYAASPAPRSRRRAAASFVRA